MRGAVADEARLTLGVLVLVAGLVLGGTASGAAQDEARAPWDVNAAGPGARSIDLYVQLGGCEHDPRPVVQETASSVTIRMLASSPSGPDVVCPAVIRRVTVRVALARPLDGRAVRGRTNLGAFVPPPAPGSRVRVPRLVGFSAWEAGRALRQRGLKQRIRSSTRPGTRARVVGQAPGAGRLIRAGGLVRLHVARP